MLKYKSLLIGYTPREYLDLITDNTLRKYDIRGRIDNIRKKYIGGYYQVGFSVLFTIAGIKQEAYLDYSYKDYKLQIPYWNDDDKKTCGGEVFLSINGLAGFQPLTMNASKASFLNIAFLLGLKLQCSPLYQLLFTDLLFVTIASPLSAQSYSCSFFH